MRKGIHCIQPSGWMRIETLLIRPTDQPYQIASSLRAGWGLKLFSQVFYFCINTLHPAFGLDEDWNTLLGQTIELGTEIASSLRAGWGLKLATVAIFAFSIALHPAFGLDEDWNPCCMLLTPTSTIASSLRAGWGLKQWSCNKSTACFWLHPAFGLDEDWNRNNSNFWKLFPHCIQPSGWMRIETWLIWFPNQIFLIASSLRAGWGLKR